MLRSAEGLVDGVTVLVSSVAADDTAAGLAGGGEVDGLRPACFATTATDVGRPTLALCVEGPVVDARV